MNACLTPDAEADLAEAYAWYCERGQALGDRFLSSIDAALAAIQHLPEANPVIHRRIRRTLVRHFPYALFYEVRDAEIVVIACFHAARDPRSWQRRGDG